MRRSSPRSKPSGWLSAHHYPENARSMFETIKPKVKAKQVTVCTSLPQKFQVHVCTHVLYFLNATNATQFSGSRHFQVCLPEPSSSCLFLSMAACLALDVRLYLPLLTISVCSVLSLRFFSGHFKICSLTVVSKISCSSLSVVTRNVKWSI